MPGDGQRGCVESFGGEPADQPAQPVAALVLARLELDQTQVQQLLQRVVAGIDEVAATAWMRSNENDPANVLSRPRSSCASADVLRWHAVSMPRIPRSPLPIGEDSTGRARPGEDSIVSRLDLAFGVLPVRTTPWSSPGSPVTRAQRTAARDRIFANPGEPEGLYVADLHFCL